LDKNKDVHDHAITDRAPADRATTDRAVTDPAISDSAITPPDQVAEPEPEPSFGQWLARNGPLLVTVAAVVVFLCTKFGTAGVAKVALGLSLVIFIHELGHFLVAKWCDVHVTTFSIGFGPPIPGCSFQWGETTYKLAVFPLGGYVQMVGQVDGDEASDGSEDDPRSYRNKSVWQRMAIISAGVVMNVILAIVTFVIVFQGPGKDRQAAVVAAVDSGSPAFKKGIPTGAQILQIGDVRSPYFNNLMVTVMSTTHGEELPLVFRRPGDREAASIKVEPMLSKGDGARPMIGIQPSLRLLLAARRDLPDTMKHPVMPGSVADEAKPLFEFGDRIIGMSDPKNPKEVTELPVDQRNPGSDQRDYFEFSRRMQLLADKDVTIRVVRGSGDKTPVDIVVPPAFHHTFGARMQMGEVTAVREGSPADRAGMHVRKPKFEGDVILKVEVADGKKSKSWGRTEKDLKSNPAIPVLDPLRLPFDLQHWADQVLREKPNAGPDDLKVIVHVRRHNTQPGQQYREERLELQWDHRWRFDEITPFSFSSPWAIPELGLAYQVKTEVAYVEQAAAGKSDSLQPGDVIKKVRLFYPDETGEKKEGPWAELESEEFAHLFWIFQQPGHFPVMKVEVERNKERKELEVVASADKTWPQPDRGLLFSKDVRRQKAASFFEAIALGFQDTYDNMRQVYQNLRGMITGRISVKNLGGPLTIARVAYLFANYDFWEFVFFIGLISVNLAVINFLPIPVLDGGHMVFLIYEKIRGKPASEGVRVAATYAGLALILSLMVFVLYLDISRLIKGS
jgi:regulator of sigma E protease